MKRGSRNHTRHAGRYMNMFSLRLCTVVCLPLRVHKKNAKTKNVKNVKNDEKTKMKKPAMSIVRFVLFCFDFIILFLSTVLFFFACA